MKPRSKSLDVSIRVNGMKIDTSEGTLLLDALQENGYHVPTLCHVEGLVPRGACRVCSVKIGNRLQTACTTPVNDGMEVITQDDELDALRKQIVEMMLAEGNHFCPFCEISGQCELQELAYQFGITISNYPYLFQDRDVEASHPKLLKDHNRCILCKRCIRLIKDEEGKRIFAFSKRGSKLSIQIDTELAKNMSDELANEAIACCPVGAMLPRNKAFQVPIGKRKYDNISHNNSTENLRENNGEK